ncbi:MAG TPA: sensor histidine kinase [Symbiobacteriaceae bacterium]|nr:sensor histidine kinase [Symbiobacteriaceae bacterium]
MQLSESRQFRFGLEIAKLLMMIASYLPFAILREADIMGRDRWVLVAGGTYLCVSMLLRNLSRLEERLPSWGRIAWLSFDFALWWSSQYLNHWDTVTLFAGFALMVDAAIIGWSLLRGLIPFSITAVFVILGPYVTGFRVGRTFWVNYATVLLPSLFLLYGLIYMAGRIQEERQAAERARREAELANAHLREYVRQVEEMAVLRERNRLAREVHDTVAHGFTGMIMQMEAITRLLQRSPDQALQALQQVQDQARDSLAEIRRSVHALRPMQMEEGKGVTALQRLVDGFASTTGVKTDLVIEGMPVELPVGHELCLYRLVQEGLTNAFRHGKASRARVRLSFGPGALIAAVEDDGRPTKLQKPGLGIMGIRERAEALGGQVEAGPSSTGGFVLQLRLPLTQTGGAASA